MKYIIDTNILINFRIFTPIKFHKTFWKQLEECVNNDEIIILQDVADECKDSELSTWIKRKKIEPVSHDIRNRANEINKQYPMITEIAQQMKSEADPVIIAFAEKNRYAVFTQEAPSKPGGGVYKIPDVCHKLGITCERWPNNVFTKIKFKTI